jgi:hypothetical protein
MMLHDAYKKLHMEQVIQAGDKKIITTRCPIRINGKKLFATKRAPRVGEHNDEITRDLINS